MKTSSSRVIIKHTEKTCQNYTGRATAVSIYKRKPQHEHDFFSKKTITDTIRKLAIISTFLAQHRHSSSLEYTNT